MDKQTLQRYWNRVGRIAIDGVNLDYGDNDPKDPLRGLDFRFDIKKTGFAYTDFSCGILGLGKESIKRMTVWHPTAALKDSRKIRVYAGYKNDQGERMLADGYVFTALPTPPPDMWMNFTCRKCLGDKTPVEYEREMKGKLGDIFGQICKELGVNRGPWYAKETDENGTGDFVISGSKDELVVNFSNAFGVSVVEENGQYEVWDLNPERTSVPPPRERSTEIDVKHGLLAVGNITAYGATVRIRLTDAFRLNQWVYLKSELVPSANSEPYFIIRKRFVGHLRGDEWYTELEMARYAGK